MLNPGILWGILAISAPIIIHFWHQKKGKVIDWAAMRWLLEIENSQSKGFRLKELFLLFLRCLLILLLVLMLGKPFFQSLKHANTSKTIHLVQANKQITENFKFEIEKALKNGEKCLWISPNNIPLMALSPMPNYPVADGKAIQKSIQLVENQLSNATIHLYFLNTQALKNIPKIYSSTQVSLHNIEDKQKKRLSFFETSDKKYIYRDSEGKLSSQLKPPPIGMRKHRGDFRVLIETSNQEEKEIIRLALRAISSTYGMAFSIEENGLNKEKWDIVFKNGGIIGKKSPEILYFLSNFIEYRHDFEENTVVFRKSILPSDYPFVFEGKLPEFLLEKILNHFEMNDFGAEKSISNSELKGLFATETLSGRFNQAWITDVLLLLFIVVLSLERWLSIQKNL